MLAVFIGLRARHMRDTGHFAEAESDYLFARCLFPNSRRLYIDCMALAIPRGTKLFEVGELGSPESLAEGVCEQFSRGPRWGNPSDWAGHDLVFTVGC